MLIPPADQSYLTLRHKTYYYRRRIPALLKHLFQQKEFFVSLKTTNLNDAKNRAEQYDYYFSNLLAKEAIKSMRLPDPKNIIRLTVQSDSQGNKKVELTPEDIVAFKDAGLSAQQIESIIQATIRNNLSAPNTEPMPEAKESPTLPADPPSSTCTLLLSKVIERFILELELSSEKINSHTLSKYQTFFRRLIEILGDKSANAVTREEAKTVLAKIKSLPSKSASYRNQTVDEILSSGITAQTFSAKTINDHLELYNRLYEWIANELDHHQFNPFKDLSVKRDKKQKKNQARHSFTRSELQTIFSTSIFTDGQYKSTYQFWAPLIALYTGARRAEIAALYVDDIHQCKNGIWVFDFNENSADKKVKTANGIRKTPIHPHLIEIGLLDFVKSRSQKRLFDELATWTEREGYGRPIGDWFNGTYLKELGIYKENKKIFYSFRHTFSTELSLKQVSDAIIEQLSGRDFMGKTVGQVHYIDDKETPTLLAELEKLDFSKELQHVQWIERSGAEN
jgi:integrase